MRFVALTLSLLLCFTGCGSGVDGWTDEDNESLEVACRDIRISAGLTSNYAGCESFSKFFRQTLAQAYEKYEGFEKDCFKASALRKLEEFYALPASSKPQADLGAGEGVEEFAEFFLDFIYVSSATECKDS